MNALHDKLVFKRRVDVLARALAKRMPQGAGVLDIGCGSGDIAAQIMALRPDVTIEGVDVLVREDTAIPVTAFDGYAIPKADGSYDLTMMVDVLHHTDHPDRLMREAARVASMGVLVKDHFRDGLAAEATLKFMDWVGNASHGVRLPYNYLSRSEWQKLWVDLGMEPVELETELELYPEPFNRVFGRQLHFITVLEPVAGQSG